MRSFGWLAILSLAALSGLAWLMVRETQPAAAGSEPLVVYCAAALKPALQAATAEYDRPIQFRFGNSEQILVQATAGREGDLFLPADDSFVRTAQDSGVVVEATPLATMRVVVLVAASNPLCIERFEDLLRKEVRLGQANPDAAAIGRVTREHLQRSGHWDALHRNTLVYHTTVTDAANAVQAGANDAAIVWDAVAANYPLLAVVKLPELQGAAGRVSIGLLGASRDPEAARRFIRFLKYAEHGQRAFRMAGFTELEP